MSANPTFVGALADAVGRPVEVSPVTEATTLGAAYLAGMALGMWADEAERGRSVEAVGGGRAPHRYRGQRAATRERWLAARERAAGHRARAERARVLSPADAAGARGRSLVTRSVRPQNVPITWT